MARMPSTSRGGMSKFYFGLISSCEGYIEKHRYFQVDWTRLIFQQIFNKSL